MSGFLLNPYIYGGGDGGELYQFSSFTFTSASTTGATGPALSTLLTSYNTTTYPWLNNTDYFNATSGIQLWTVPATGTYTIEAWGAAGNPISTTNRGAYIKGTFNLIKGDKIRILVGQYGGTNSGGGSSFVVKNGGTTVADIYVIAGGGGGKSGGAAGQAGNSNSSATVNNGNGGLSAGSTSYPGAAGGGFFTNGGATVGTPASATGFGKGFLSNDGTGGTGGTGPGGFGGGGSGGADNIAGAGGGGGYSGGSGGPDNSVGQGAGSYNNGTNATNTTGGNTSQSGQVLITRIT